MSRAGGTVMLLALFLACLCGTGSAAAQEEPGRTSDDRVKESAVSGADEAEILDNLELLENLDMFMEQDVELLNNLELFLANS